MVRSTETLAKAALALPPKSRAQLAERLLSSLDDPHQKDIDMRWAKEAENRIEAFEQGRMRTIPANEVFRSLSNALR